MTESHQCMPRTLFEMAALKWMCSVVAQNQYLDEQSFGHITDMINVIGNRLEFGFDYSCFYLEALEDVLLRCIGYLKPEYVEHWFIGTYQIRSALSNEGYTFGLGLISQDHNLNCEFWDGSAHSEIQNTNDGQKS